MPQGNSLFVARHLAWLALLGSLDAAAWDWRANEPTAAAVAFQPHFLAATAEGYWASGDTLVRYDRQSHVLARAPFDRKAWLVPLPGGGVVAAAEAAPGGWLTLPVPCTLEGYADDARARWQSDALPAVEGCDAVAAGPQGAIWVSYRDAAGWKLQAYDDRGVARGRLTLSAPVRDLIADPLLARAYVLAGAQLLTVDDRAQVLSSLATERAGGGRLALGPGRQLLLAEPGSGSLHLLRLDLDTGVRSDRNLAASPAPQTVDALASDPAGQIYVLDHATAYSLRRLGSDGSLAWSTPLESSLGACASFHGRCSLYADSDGVLVPMLRANTPAPGSASLALERYTAAGGRRGGSVLEADRLRGLVPLADGASLVVASHAPESEQPPPQTWRVLRDGSAAAVAAALDGAARAQAVAVASTPAGDSYLLSNQGELFGGASDRHHGLTALTPEGSTRWRRTLPGYWDSASVLAAGTDRVCIGGSRYDSASQPPHLRIVCFERASGRTLWESDLGVADYASPSIRLALLADGDVVALASGTASVDSVALRHLRLGADGALQHDIDLGTAPWRLDSAVFGSAGDVLLLQDRGHLARIDAAGTKRHAAALPGGGNPSSWPLLDATVANDGSAFALLLGQTSVAWSLSPDGVTRWARSLDSGVVTSGNLRRSGDTVDIATTVYDAGTVEPRLHVRRLRGSDGAFLWQASLAEPANGQLVTADDPNTVLLVGSAAHALRLRWLDPLDGHTLATAGETCAEVSCAYLGPRLAGDGVLRLGLAGYDLPVPALVGRRGVLPTTPAVAVDQHALGGAWYATYENGQGFLLDVLMPQRVFFMPWFTYTGAGGNDPAALRWYTLQGDIPAAARQLEVGIYENRGGNFDAAPVTQAQRVGTASVRFDSCDSAQLHYRFDAGHNDGREGDISLSRLLPRNEACVQGDGSISAAVVATPAQGGFDARLGGSWFEPASAGQGVQLTLQPGGVFFGGWFTYDPAEVANDPTRQHWLTLQGTLAGARDGVASVAIVQAIGGRFDALPTANQYVVGQATFHVLGCDRLRLDYRFDDRIPAGPFRARSGSVDLVKIGGCTP